MGRCKAEQKQGNSCCPIVGRPCHGETRGARTSWPDRHTPETVHHPARVYVLHTSWPFLRAQSCYGVLHCSLDGSDSLELEDNACKTELTIPPDRHSYNEYDAIVVSRPSMQYRYLLRLIGLLPLYPIRSLYW